MKSILLFSALLSQLFSLLFSMEVYALTQIKDDMSISCYQSTNLHNLTCRYRNSNADPVLSITAEYANTFLPVDEGDNYPNKNAITAVLFMIDTSDPARQNVVGKNIVHIKEFLLASKEYHRFGLLSFNKELKLIVPIGSELSMINNAAKDLKATGTTTELYKNILGAIKLFRDVDAERKSIFLFSDGLAEDKAYFHEDVVKAARKAGIIITSIGYPRSVAKSVYLQTLARLSEETGGKYIEADHQFDIPAYFLSQPYTELDNGGEFNVHLQKIVDNKIHNETNIKLTFETDMGTSILLTPVTFNLTPIIQELISSSDVVKEENTTPEVIPIQIVTKEVLKTSTLETWLWYIILVALGILIILTIATFFVTLRKQHQHPNNIMSFPDVKPYAFLIAQDESKTKYPINSAISRLGRSGDNEITLLDSSVSRFHAVIHYNECDEFILIDLNSLNSVFVNNEKIGRYKLEEGNIIEIGDVKLIFTSMPVDCHLEETKTFMQSTKGSSL